MTFLLASRDVITLGINFMYLFIFILVDDDFVRQDTHFMCECVSVCLRMCICVYDGCVFVEF